MFGEKIGNGVTSFPEFSSTRPVSRSVGTGSREPLRTRLVMEFVLRRDFWYVELMSNKPLLIEHEFQWLIRSRTELEKKTRE